MGVETLLHTVQQHNGQHSLLLTSASGQLQAALRSVSTESGIDGKRTLLSERLLDVLRKSVGWVVFTFDLFVNQLFLQLFLLQPQALHIDVTHLPGPLSFCDA